MNAAPSSLKMKIYESLHEAFRCCLHCGSFQCWPSQFCSSCESDLWRAHPQLQNFEIEGSTDPGFALFDWYPDQDRKVSKLMISMKGGRLQQCFGFYAQEFVSRYPDSLPSQSLLVPCPSTSNRLHSQVLAQSFGRLLQIPVADCLRKQDQAEQKGKNKQARSKVRIRNEEDLSRQHVIFIDDIVTTGATAQAARKAIGSCLSFQVWCLAHRRQLAALPSF